MIKLFTLYKKPVDIEAFDRHYFNVHLPLVRQTPGLDDVEITTITGTLPGETKYHILAEMTYPSAEAMDAANASPEGRAVARDLLSFAPDGVTLFYGEVRR